MTTEFKDLKRVCDGCREDIDKPFLICTSCPNVDLCCACASANWTNDVHTTHHLLVFVNNKDKWSFTCSRYGHGLAYSQQPPVKLIAPVPKRPEIVRAHFAGEGTGMR